MKELNIEIPEGYEIDRKTSNLLEGKIRFKLIDDKFNQLVKQGLDGFTLVDNNHLGIGVVYVKNIQKSLVFKTQEQAKSAAAYCKLTQLMALPEYNGNWHTDWNSIAQKKFSIKGCQNNLTIEVTYCHFSHLSFKSVEIAQTFLTNHRDLIEDFYMSKNYNEKNL